MTQDTLKNHVASVRQRKGGVRDAPTLTEVVSDLAAFLWPVLEAAARGGSFEASWAPGGPWRTPSEAMVEVGQRSLGEAGGGDQEP